ncbi:hypothetical protein [Telluribacter sp.]|jgi:hypothetical protein|uniref:hypothetical protein n=1 Tax=Telluribacter sp. TaxID=1978767 RepID=UPI002E14C95B|nr:hypothetical protein [Telluribacter sp.]
MNLTKENGEICSLSYLYQTYGEDALQPCRIVTDERDDELITVPKIRAQMSVDEWFGLPQEFRLFVLKAFYQSL